MKCPNCEGTGVFRNNNKDCPDCRGTGEIQLGDWWMWELDEPSDIFNGYIQVRQHNLEMKVFNWKPLYRLERAR